MARTVLEFRRPAAEVADEVLLQQIAVGDRAALGALFDRHGDAVHRFLGRLGGVDHQDRGDLTQATFMQVPTAAARFDGRAQPRTWLFGIALNVARNHIRRDVRRKRMLALIGQREAPRSPDPSRDAATAQAMGRLRAALERLPLKFREAFVMCQVEGIPGVEAAAALGVPEGTLYRRLHEARRRIRDAIGDAE